MAMANPSGQVGCFSATSRAWTRKARLRGEVVEAPPGHLTVSRHAPWDAGGNAVERGVLFLQRRARLVRRLAEIRGSLLDRAPRRAGPARRTDARRGRSTPASGVTARAGRRSTSQPAGREPLPATVPRANQCRQNSSISRLVRGGARRDQLSAGRNHRGRTLGTTPSGGCGTGTAGSSSSRAFRDPARASISCDVHAPVVDLQFEEIEVVAELVTGQLGEAGALRWQSCVTPYGLEVHVRSRCVRSRRRSPCPPSGRRASSSWATRAPRSAARAPTSPRSRGTP